MPNALTEKRIESLKEFTSFIEQALRDSERLWYRGCGKALYKLTPSLYRHPHKSTIDEFLEIESSMIRRFRERSMPYLDRPLSDDWEYLFLMQHFGVPTRLLDWTENPFIALYFALTAAEMDRGGNIYSENAAVWVLNPIIWNRTVLRHISFKGGILSKDDKASDGYKPRVEIDLMNSLPIAIYGTYNSQRIVAQKGVFMLFGRELKPIEDIYRDSDFTQDCLIKLVLPSGKIHNLLESIVSIGYTDSVVFPDLDGLAKEIKRLNEYEV